MDFKRISYDKPNYNCVESVNWRIYADALREFGIFIFIENLITGSCNNNTQITVKELVSQYGLRNVTNEFSRQLRRIMVRRGKMK